MPAQVPQKLAINIFGCHASDDAWANGLAPELDANHPATISQDTYEAIVAARKALDENPAWESIAITSDIECQSLDDALDEADTWQTGSEDILIHRFPGLYLRLLHKHNRQAEIEFEIAFQDGTSIPAPRNPQ